LVRSDRAKQIQTSNQVFTMMMIARARKRHARQTKLVARPTRVCPPGLLGVALN
jgi:hypothetical protein